MAILKGINENEATGAVAQIFQGVSEVFGKVPNVIKFHSVSPDIFPKFMGLIQHFSDHSSLDPVLITYLRIIVSYNDGGDYCVRFQSSVARSLGETQERINQAKKDVTKLSMDEKRKALLVFAVQLIAGTIENTEQKVEELKVLGWTEKEIYEFCFIGALQKGGVPLVKGFKVKADF